MAMTGNSAINDENATTVIEILPVEKWQSVKGPQIMSLDDTRVRGSFHLGIDLCDLDRIWITVKWRTVRGQLGYLCSLSPAPMMYGKLHHKWTISIHTLHEEKERTQRLLENWDLFQYVYKYDVNKKFREILRDQEQLYNGFVRYY